MIGQQIVSDINQITDIYISYGYVESDGTVTLVGDEGANIDADGFATGFFDTYQLWIGDGANETSFYSSYSVNQESDVATIGVPIAYFAARLQQRIAGVPADELRAEHGHDPLRDVLRPG